MAANWAELPGDILVYIAKGVKVMEDFIAFGGVCTSWRTAAPKENFDGFVPQLPLLMLADKDDDYREFYSLSRGKVTRGVYLPEARGRQCFPTEWGWMLTVSNTGDYNLLHPFTRSQIQLPPRTLLLDIPQEEAEEFDYCICKAVVTANPSLTSDYVVVVAFFGGCNMAFWRPGDPNWTDIHIRKDGAVCSIVYHKGQFYFATWSSQLWLFDVADLSNARLIKLQTNNLFSRALVMVYLVELSGALVSVVRFSDESGAGAGAETYKFEVYELDLTNGELKEINTLGDSAIFVGDNGSCSVDCSKFTGVKPNHIYFVDDYDELYERYEGGGGRDMGAYNLEDGKIESFYPGLSLSPICPPTWVTPSLS